MTTKPDSIFALRVTADTLAPMHRAGDIIIVDASRPPVAGETVVVIGDDDEVYLAIFERCDGGHIVARQWRPPRVLRLAHVAVHRVIGMNEWLGAPSAYEVEARRIGALGAPHSDAVAIAGAGTA